MDTPKDKTQQALDSAKDFAKEAAKEAAKAPVPEIPKDMAKVDKGLAEVAEEFHDEILENLTEAQKQRYAVVIKSLKGHEYLTNQLDETSTTVRGTFGERLADKVAQFGGSWTFIMWFAGILIGWMVLNVVVLNDKGFDPYPFILLNLCLSCLAAIQAPVIMMSQNRKEQKDRRRAEDDYLTNLKAEIEVRQLHQKMTQLLGTQKSLVTNTQKEQEELLKTLQSSLNALRKTVNGLCLHLDVPEVKRSVKQASNTTAKAEKVVEKITESKNGKAKGNGQEG